MARYQQMLKRLRTPEFFDDVRLYNVLLHCKNEKYQLTVPEKTSKNEPTILKETQPNTILDT